MNIDTEKLRELIKNFPNTPEGKVYIENMRKTNEIKMGRYLRFEEWLKHNDFDKLMYRLILEHGDEWHEKCWSKGCEVYMNNKLAFIFDYVVHHREPINVPQIESKHFPCECWFFKGYYFQITYGQGSIVDVYNGDDFKHLLQA